MPCLTELQFSVYVDGELPERDAQDALEHLERCPNCESRVAALRQESLLLIHSFQDVDTLEQEEISTSHPPPIPDRAQLATFAMLVAGVAVGLRAVQALFAGFEMPGPPDWLNPASLSGQLNLLVGVLTYAGGEGATMIGELIDNWSNFALVLTILFGVVALLRRSAATNAVFTMALPLALIVGFAASASAIDVRNGQGTVTLATNETVNDTVFASGDIVTIDGNVNGDVIAVGRQISVNGNVSGNILACGRQVEVTGAVGGTVFQCGQSVLMSGKVGHDYYALAETIKISKDAVIGANALMGSMSDSTIDGHVGRDVLFGGGVLSAGGNIGRNVWAASRGITILSMAHIGGNLNARVKEKENVRVDAGAVIVGRQNIELPKPEPSPYTTARFYFRQILWIAVALVTGLVLFWLFPGLRRANIGDAASIVKTAAIGFLGTFFTPVAAFVVGITIVGLPIALIGVAAWLTGLYLAKIVVAEFIGRALLGRSDHMSATALALLVGLLPVAIAVNLPFVGGLLNILLVLVGFGVILTASWRKQSA